MLRDQILSICRVFILNGTCLPARASRRRDGSYSKLLRGKILNNPCHSVAHPSCREEQVDNPGVHHAGIAVRAQRVVVEQQRGRWRDERQFTQPDGR